MWHALLTAAVAGSTGLVAKHLFKSACGPNPEQARNLDHNEDVSEDVIEVDEIGLSNENETFSFDSEPPVNCESLISENRKEDIFRFSSTSGENSSSASRFVSRGLSKRLSRWTKKGFGVERLGGSLPRNSGRKVGVCLKKRKIIKSVATKCGSCSRFPNPSGEFRFLLFLCVCFPEYCIVCRVFIIFITLGICMGMLGSSIC